MKILTPAAAITLALITASALGQHEQHQTPVPATAAASASDATPAQTALAPLQQRLAQIQTEWNQLGQTADPAERQRLMQQHGRQLQELAALLSAVQSGGAGTPAQEGGGKGCGMMGHGGGNESGGGMSHGGKKGGAMMSHGGAAEEHAHHQEMLLAVQQMEKRLDLLQGLVERLLDRQP